ncbi:MAG: ion transporter [Bacteroidaceae bacterium]|nr:ion transporter [Bacteroidaceae bacterium]
MSNIKDYKKKLARVFDNDLGTEQWGNVLDYIIIGLIVLSTLGVFVSTFNVSPTCELVLYLIDIVTVIAFTIEVTLRIWVADEMDARYKGFWGRVKYCCTFYGLIDVLSTYSFYVALFFPLPYAVLKSLRVLRLLRVFRYMRSFRLLQQALLSKSKEMCISLQFLVVVTLMLSFVLYFSEHAAQPEVYDNGMKSVVWAFAQYIGDPGGFADTPPITGVGRIIACIHYCPIKIRERSLKLLKYS